MKITDIYTKYQIMLSLQLHQLRVASVAQLICDSFIEKNEIESRSVVTACLLHDMGNIIKSDLSYFPDFVKPEGLDYWQKIKDDFIDKYGRDEHVATKIIASEIFETDLRFKNYEEKNNHKSYFINHNSSIKVMELLDAIGFSNAKIDYESENFNKKIAIYSDMRVMPRSVDSMKNRLEDGRIRFKQKSKKYDQAHFDEMVSYLEKIELQIFERANISPADIDNEKIEKILPQIREFEI